MKTIQTHCKRGHSLSGDNLVKRRSYDGKPPMRTCKTCSRDRSREKMGWPRRKPLTKRFWEKVAVGPKCWLWKASPWLNGYGRFWNGVKNTYAHQVAWQLANGRSIPNGLHILHSCNVKLCVRPSHLYPGTQLQNVADSIAAGTFNCGRGERHGHARLTTEQVLAIRRKASEGKPYQKLAEDFDVSPATIWSIRTRKTWRHI